MSPIVQAIRIALQIGGGVILGDGISDGEPFQAAIGGLVNFLTFCWWAYQQHNVKK